MPNYHLAQINQRWALRSPGRGTGASCAHFGQAAWGWCGDSLSTWPNNFRRRESFPDYDAWLGPTTLPEDFRKLLRPYDESLMEAYAVSRKVNSVKNDTEECIEPIDDDQG